MKAGHRKIKLDLRALKRCRGYSLVELMVALVVSLLLTLLAAQGFIALRTAFGDVATLSRNVDSLSYFSTVMVEDFRRANSFTAVVDGEEVEDGEGEVELSAIRIAFLPLLNVGGVCSGEGVSRKEYSVIDGSLVVSYECGNNGDEFEFSEKLVDGVVGISFSRGEGDYTGAWFINIFSEDGNIYRFMAAVRGRVLTS